MGHQFTKYVHLYIGIVKFVFILNIHIIYIIYKRKIQPSVYIVYTSAMFGKLDSQSVHLRTYPFILFYCNSQIMGCEIPHKVLSEFIEVAV